MKKFLLKNNNRKIDNKMSTDAYFASSHAITLISLVITIVLNCSFLAMVEMNK